MGEKTSIEWTEHTWNPWHGCQHVSPGCEHCYMFAAKRRYGQDPTAVVRSRTTFDEPLKWKKPRLVFTCSWSDFFIAEADPWRAEAWGIIRRTPHLTYQILTKRPARIASHLPPDWPLQNVWLGVSVEARVYRYRADVLRRIPAAVRFLSLEPLLEHLAELNLNGIHWVIAGGESGPGHRPVDADWLRAIRDRCQAAGVPFFFKQWGGRTPKSGGRLLDGRTWDEMPERPSAVSAR